MTTLNNPASASFDLFGNAVAANNTLAVIGASGDDPGGVSGSGSAYVLNVSTGVVQSILVNPESASGDGFGFSVDISPDGIAVVGAPFDNPGAVNDVGSAYVFNATTGALLATLNNPFPAALDGFGFDVAIDGPLVVIGSLSDDTGGAINSGSAFVFDWTTGAVPPVLVQLANPASSNYDNFGKAVDIKGNKVVVGAPGETGPSGLLLNSENKVVFDVSGENAVGGAAYAYLATSGGLSVTLENPSPVSGDSFGDDVSISGSWIGIGAFGDNSDGVAGAGIAYIYDHTGSLASTLHDPNPTEYEYFGDQISISETFGIVGKQYADLSGIGDAGTGHVFNLASGELLATLDNPTPHDEDWACGSVAISDTAIVIGAANDNPGNVTDAGTAYAYTLDDDATFVSHTIPLEIPQNHTTPISVTFCNTGGTEWTTQGVYDMLDISDDCDLLNDADFELELEADEEVEVTDSYEFVGFFTEVTATPGPCSVEFSMTRNAIPFGQPKVVNFMIAPANNDADISSHTIRLIMRPYEHFNHGLVVRNTGNTAWIPQPAPGAINTAKDSPKLQAAPPGSNHALGVFGSDDCNLFSQTRFAPTDIVFPGKSFQAIVSMTAPAAPAECTFTLRMLEENVEWFGETLTLTISVEEPANSAHDWATYQ